VAKFETFAHVETEEIHENRRDIPSWSRFERTCRECKSENVHLEPTSSVEFILITCI
jgi:hypothetical protein